MSQVVINTSSSASALEPHKTVTSRVTGTVNYINAREVTNAEDLLAEIGYKQELRRTYSTFEVFGIAFSIMGLLPSIATIITLGLVPGPAALVWGWFIVGAFIFGVGVSMAELASAIPTSGGLYYWTYHYAPVKYKAALSFLVGTTNSMALAGAVCSITYAFAQQFITAIYLGLDGSFKITDAMIYGAFAGAIIIEMCVTCFSTKSTSKLQMLSIVCNVGLIVLFLIALPIGTKMNAKFNDAKFIFAKYDNLSDWPDGWAFFQFGFMPAVWTIGAFDSCVHMSEESKTPSRSVPIGILGSITACWIGGFIINIVICACMTTDIESVLNTGTGQPLMFIIQSNLGKKWAVAFSAMAAFCQLLMASSTLTAISRQVWAFARDDGLPFSRYIKIVDKKTQVPRNAVAASAVAALAIGCLILAGPVAANSLFSIGMIGLYVTYAIPQILRFTSGRGIFRPGIFYTGKILSPIINFVTIVYQLFIVILAMFPDSTKVEGPSTMNYAVAVNCGVWVLSMIYFAVWKHKTYHGPKSNLDDDDDDYDSLSVHDGHEMTHQSSSGIIEKS
ncbi:GABA-specific permease [Wickerhamomyces ciferrii]|uniref:GABA-specific permease n=1 Tax=Wickerhamomyces ciferrii (strain ATCC 14091 / BCRC 22168 / CBS 111 / JCM 3599 / NBRC 0793 / NRRL Y-1031 F-60-10) TaxID=1206466 RepID=K0KW85_WICCF|nr:GABA-specific permease [Wickerhamomyces ciferrii]CCH45754.1 GABA-specific permease [Wickerhamomyces ciferrii]